jgi:uracil-DNA glycosylase family 4
VGADTLRVARYIASMSDPNELAGLDPVLESLLDWWRLQGVDVEDADKRLLAELAPASARTAARRVHQADAERQSPQPADAAKHTAADAVAQARRLANAAATLEELAGAIATFEHCPLKLTARSTVFADGVRGADVMLIGEAPGRDEDESGLPFVGRSGQLLDRMLAFIGLRRTENLYISNVLPWRPPGNRTPTQSEILICMPFIERHVALAKPKLVILAGGVAAQAMLKSEDGIMKLRGRETRLLLADAAIPALAMFHPAYLLRRPADKKRAWEDLCRLEILLEKYACARGARV